MTLRQKASVVPPGRFSPVGVALLYAAVATLWIIMSEALLSQLGIDSGLRARIELAKGLAFVGVTSALLYALLRRVRGLALAARESAADKLMENFFQLPFIGMAMTSPTSKHWVRFNDRLCEILGYSRDELASKTWSELTHPDDLEADVAQFERVMRGETDGYVINKRYIRKDGTFVYTTLDVKAVRDTRGEVEYFFATIQDISERRATEALLLRQRGLHAALSAANHAIARGSKRDEVFRELCMAAVERAGFRFAWIGLSDPVAGQLRPVMHAGEDRGYMEELRVSLDAGEPLGAGPGGRAIRDNAHQIVNDIDADNSMEPWRARAEKADVRALAAFPVHRAGAVVGAICVYAGDAGVFDADAVALLDDLAADLSFALDNFERERHRAEAVDALAASEQRWHFALEGAGHGVWAWNVKTNRVFYSHEWKAKLGFGDDDIGDGIDEWEARVHPDDIDDARLEIRRHLAGETPSYMDELRMRCMDGSYKWMQARAKVMTRDSDGSPLTLIGTQTDISERMRQEELLRSSEERFRHAIEEAPFPILIHAEDGAILSSSRAWRELSGYSPEDIPTIADWVERAYGQRKAIVQEEIDTLYSLSSRKDEGEYVIRCKDGTRRVWMFSSVSLGRESGGRRVAISMAADVTDRKRTEQSLALRDAVLSALGRSARRFLDPAQPWKDVVQTALADVGVAAEVSRVYLFERLEGAGETLVNRQICEWVAPGVRPFLDDPALQRFVWAEHGATLQAQALERGEPVFSHRRELPGDFGRLLQGEDTESIALVPIVVRGRTWGFVGFDACGKEKEWSTSEQDVLGLVATTLGAAIEQEATREEVVESEARFRGLVEQSLVGIFIVDTERLLYSNPRATEILGYAPDELQDANPRKLIVVEDWPAVERELQRVLNGEVSIGRLECRTRCKDGSEILVGAEGLRILHQGRPAVLGVMQDITERRRAESQIRGYVAQLQSALMSTVEVAMTLSELRDPYTAGHERRVAEIAVAIGAELGFDAKRQEGLRVAGYLHDVGKMMVPSEILSRPGKLSSIEYELIKGHSQSGYNVLKAMTFPWPVAEVALQHHERLDGSGYPQGLKGDEIIVEARIMAVADVVEAMSSHRPYRASLGVEAALAEIEKHRGTHYWPAAVDACLRIFREKGYTIPA